MKILITGAAGFIGMHVARQLLREGHAVLGMDNFSPYYDVELKRSRLRQLSGHPRFEFVELDICHADALQAHASAWQPEAVVHLAAQVGVRHSLVDPHAYSSTNLVGFVNVLELCRKLKTNHLVYASSSSVYGSNQLLPYSEQHSVDHPISLYAATKKSNELMAHAYSHLYGLPTTGLRFFTVYGPWGRPDMAAYKFATAIASGQPIDIYNHGNMLRDFTFVADVAESVVRVVSRPPTSDPSHNPMAPTPQTSHAAYRVFNVGNAQPVRLGDFVDELERCLGIPAIRHFLPLQPGDVVRTAADTEALEQWIGTSPDTPLARGVSEFVAWFQRYQAEQVGTAWAPPACCAA